MLSILSRQMASLSLTPPLLVCLMLLAIPASAYSPFSKSGPPFGAPRGGPPFVGPGGPPPFGAPPSFARGPAAPFNGPLPHAFGGPPPPFAAPHRPPASISLVDQPTTPRSNPFQTVFAWKGIDFLYPTQAAHARAIATGDFVPENNLPLGLGRSKDRLFVTLPRWKNGVPASLAWLPLPPGSDARAPPSAPPLIPYPDWEAHGDPLQPGDCSQLMSVYRLFVDECQRLWVIDSGVVNATIAINQVCPPKIVAFDLRTDRQLFAHALPADQVKEDSLHSNIIVDVRHGQCNDAYAYVTDVWRYGVVVFSLASRRSWRTTHHFYLPTPQLSDYRLHGVPFQWTDGVFGLSLSPLNEYADRLMFFHPMSSYAEFMVSTAVLRNETLWTAGGGGSAAASAAFVEIGERGDRGQSSTSGLDRRGVQFFNLIHADAVGCWDTRKPYAVAAFGGGLDVVARDNRTLVFPNDMKVDHEQQQVSIETIKYAILTFG